MVETTAQPTTTIPCKACGTSITQKSGRGHRPRNFCDNTCKQKFYRRTHHPVSNSNVTIEKNYQAQIAALEQEIRVLKMLASRQTRGKDRIGLQQRLLTAGQATGYPSVSVRVTIGQGADAWRTFAKDASEDMLARTIVAAGGA